MNKATVDEIKKRFDSDVERFSNLKTGQVSTVDAKITLELTTEAAKRLVPDAENLLDVGCGAGNYTMMMLSKMENLNCTLLDISDAMLEKARERVSQVSKNKVNVLQTDIRDVNLPDNSFDIILAGAVLHHLRDDSDWEKTFLKLYKLLKPNGCLMISDLISQETDVLNEYAREKYAEYLESVGGEAYRKEILDFIDREDTPRPMNYQLDLMKKVGFGKVEILHKNICFGAFGGIK